MADYTKTIDLADHKVGDNWIGIAEIRPTINEATPANALTRVRMMFRKGSEEFVLDSRGDNGISIDNAANWQASIAGRDDFLPSPGLWTWDMEFYQVGQTKPWTLYKGTLRVHEDA
ncbi:MAG: hypothetical protein AAGG44_13970 [Planctomycetota bacterium]